jgi:polyhydroxybutyrate depolymerase
MTMITSRRRLLLGIGGLGLGRLLATGNENIRAAPLVSREWTVGGISRSALVAAPESARTAPSPLVFVFHGHGGTMRQAARSFGLHPLWPEAVVVYPQGLNTPGILTDPKGKRPGWQMRAGAQGDRDLLFFDAMLASLRREYRIDERRVYSTGHSNGGAFTYLLWARRGEALAAVAPSGAVDLPSALALRPKPVLHVAGKADALVKFAWQERMMERLRRVNGCSEGKPWAPNCTLYPSKTGNPVVTMIHEGGHAFPPEAPPLIVRFFREHPRAE